ncbi:hypothetical protein Y032_0019g3905 [Ancylostoma ceylanicum]|uniref:GDSL-like protein n=1 Tax=Ancylostoma ceylanicum TaxID=53326 RepID=A0A016V1R0_9BILA|nr:hypothetical protein Y032_0019g3905 [Ancylostoma ceylanicum]
MQIRNLLSFQRPFKSPQQKVAVLMMPSIVAALVIVNVTRLFLPSEKDSEWDVGTTQSKELSRLPSVGGFFDCDRDSMKPSPSDPDDVNKVRPADIKSIGALGDSITAGYKSKNFDYEPDGTYMGNSFITGADEPLEQHATIANILRKFNPNLEGLSYSIPAERAGFNVAFPGANSSQLPTQAETLVELFRKEEVAYEIQNERNFDSSDFTVVAQGFMDELSEPVKDANGAYNKKFYASDLFHLSKYGNAVLALHLWNCLLEPAGKKNQKADLSNDGLAVQCPKQPHPYIRTLGNSFV